MRHALWMILGTLVFGTSHSDATSLQPFVATYAVSFRGLNGGTLQMSLEHDPQKNQYVFETRANPSILARFVVSRDAVERTTFEATATGIRPLHWQLDDGKSGKSGDGQLTFDWTTNRVTGEYEGKPVDLPTQPGLQDRLSIQFAVTAALIRGQDPGSIVMVNGDRTREYTYTRGATAPIDTALGKMDATLFESTRPNSSRLSRVWHAPSLAYTPVRAEQLRKGNVETVMTLISFERK